MIDKRGLLVQPRLLFQIDKEAVGQQRSRVVLEHLSNAVQCCRAHIRSLIKDAQRTSDAEILQLPSRRPRQSTCLVCREYMRAQTTQHQQLPMQGCVLRVEAASCQRPP